MGAVPVSINATFMVVTLLIGLQFREASFVASWVIVVLVSVLIHEWGHVAALRLCGRDSRVELAGLGGMTISEDQAPLRPMASIGVSLAGPIAGLAFGLFTAALLPDPASRFAHVLAYQLWFVNIWWSLFNLLPILPLDGGHVALELFEVAARRPGGAVAAMGAATVGVVGGGLTMFGPERANWILLVAALMIATTAARVPITRGQRRAETARDAHQSMLSGDLAGGSSRLMSIMAETRGADITVGAYTTLAWALLHDGRFDELCQLDLDRVHENHRDLIGGAIAWFRGDMTRSSALVTHALATGTVEPPVNYFRVTFGRLGEIERLGLWIDQLPPEQARVARARLSRSLSTS